MDIGLKIVSIGLEYALRDCCFAQSVFCHVALRMYFLFDVCKPARLKIYVNLARSAAALQPTSKRGIKNLVSQTPLFVMHMYLGNTSEKIV